MNTRQFIIELLGRDSYIKGANYYEEYIEKIKTDRLSDDSGFIHLYNVESERTSTIYNIYIKNNGRKILDYSCSCQQFKIAHSCKHLAAILYNEFDDEISRYEIIDEFKISKNILNIYDTGNNKKKNIKKELNTEYEFDFGSEITLKTKIGLDKLYVVKQNKLTEIENAMKYNQKYSFGKSFTLDFDKMYFNANDKRVFDYLIEANNEEYGYSYSYYGSYKPNPFTIQPRNFEYFISLIDKPFKINGISGTFDKINHGMPTNYKLTQEGDVYNLFVEDLENYYFLDTDLKITIYDHKLYILQDEESSYLQKLMDSRISYLKFKKEDLSAFNSGIYMKIRNKLNLDSSVDENIIPIKPKVRLYFDLNKNLSLKLIFGYKEDINYFDKYNNILRDYEYEKEVVDKLSTYGFTEDKSKFIIEELDGSYYFLENVICELPEEYEVYTSKKIDNTDFIKKTSTTTNFSIGQDGIMSYTFDVKDIQNEELTEIFKALKSKQRYYKLKNNNILNLSENEGLNEFANLTNDLELEPKDLVNGKIDIPKYKSLYIDSLKSNKYKNIKTNNLFDDFIDNFNKYKKLKIKFDKDENKILRDYQKDGVKWLSTIYKCDLGGILADEMGLGKSIQTISFIKQILKEKKDAKILIVAPTSLIYNWENEFKKFGKDLKYIVVADNKEKRKEIIDNHDKYNIFITTYGLIRNDNNEYENINFELCIIDEAQAIKNYQASMTKEVKKIKSKCKIALTGTPIENNITEIWSIFDFIMPGYLSNIANFKSRYNIKDVTNEDIKIMKSLNTQISPFILSRKKKDVAKSLPEKIENNIFLELPKNQKLLYLKELEETKKEMHEVIREDGFTKGRMKILQLLTKLRQICIDPSVMYENYHDEKIKIEELISIINNNKSEHKILIFSSFKRVLDNLSQELNKNKISYYMIDGSVKSKDRMKLVDAFNKDDTNCFLITLKSGGTGLNLVGADMVIHLDIWWNPQVENQATDRAHRIGQEKKVTVVKLITRGTIEEKILELQEKKKILCESIIGGDTVTELLSNLSEQDIRKLLANATDE